MTARRIGAYVLPGDTTWLEKTLPQYYPLVDAVVIPVPSDSRGWTGVPIAVAESLTIIDRVDVRHLARRVEGSWTDRDEPMHADTAQRQAALDAFGEEVDWVIQLDNDEYLPDPDALLTAIDEAERRGLVAVEWPMRVLFRRTRRHMFEIVSSRRRPRYDYPGAVAVRTGVRLTDARRAAGPFLRVVVAGDESSLQIRHELGPQEQRWAGITHDQAILHDSWARTPAAIRQKTRSWGHASGWRGWLFYSSVWLPSPLTWRLLRDVHPFARGLWPRVQRRDIAPEEREG